MTRAPETLMGVPDINAGRQTLSQALSRALSTKFTTKLATKGFRPQEALAKPAVCASEGVRVRGSGYNSSLNPGLLNPDSCRRAGFSLVEILVATTILLIIVMMISMVFQQTSGAYQSGTRRVKSQTVLRSVLGTIARDLTLATDSRDYPGLDNEFTAPYISFIALTGIPDDKTPGKRATQWIEYRYESGVVWRHCTELSCTEQGDGTVKWSKAGSKQSTKLNPSQPLTTFFFEITHDPTPGSMLPLRVDVQGAIETDGKSSFVSGQSAGKDRKWNTADDIYVGGGKKK